MHSIKIKCFFCIQSFLFFVCFFACKFLLAHEVQKQYQPRRAKPKYTFSEPKEVFDSSCYQAERYSVYQYLYAFFEKNPINFKSLNQGKLILHFSHNSGMYKFDSVLNQTSKQNLKVLKFFGKNFSSPIITDSSTLTLEIYVRKSKKISNSLDTFDLFSSKNSFANKTKLDVYEKGIYTNSANVLKSIIERHQIKTYKSNFGEELVYVRVFQSASFISGIDGFYKYLDDQIDIPNQLIDEEFPCRMKVFFEVNVEGKIQTITVERKKPTDAYSENLYKQMENELIRIFKRQPKWFPKIQNGWHLKSRYSVDFDLRYDW